MKRIVTTFTFLLGVVCLSGCAIGENFTFESEAVIEGYDFTLCGCCGGWMIFLDGQEDDLRRFEVLPEGSGIDLDNMEFPITVRLNWSDSESFCGNGIEVEAIELVELTD
ncbi:MAG TPA: hypothetical protein DCE41_27450 [Cytophagales bacterium]|nr:hypothetical protein [Cytophagales bacterium]HAA21812.1 hypothetical protein [Cytophagales bacterium]HAP64748.1 hypothetical protein [Cytophagales bacterium]